MTYSFSVQKRDGGLYTEAKDIRDVRDITTQALVRTSDTSTAAVVAKPSRNTVLTLDDSVTNSTINTKVGLNISATPEVEEI